MRIRGYENFAAEDDVLTRITEQINGGIQSCVENHMMSSSVASSCFSVKVEVIIPCIESSARDVLALLFGKKYVESTTGFGLKLNGRPRGHKTLVEIDTERHRDFAAGDLKSVWDDLEMKRIPRGEKVVDELSLVDMTINENKWRHVNPKKLKTMIGTHNALVKHLELDAVIDRRQMVDLEAEINRNVDTVGDLLNEISTLKKRRYILNFAIGNTSKSQHQNSRV